MASVISGLLLLFRRLDYLNYRSVLLILPFLLFLSLSASLRDGLGNDYYPYKELFELLASGEGADNFEIGFLFLIKMFLLLGVSFEVFLFFYTLLSLVIISIAIKEISHRRGWILSISVFLLLYFYPLYFGQIRQALAITFCLLAYSCYLNKYNKFYTFLFWVVAVSFHVSAFVFCLAFISHRLMPYVKTVVYVCLGLFFLLFIDIRFMWLFVADLWGWLGFPMSQKVANYIGGSSAGRIGISPVHIQYFLFIIVSSLSLRYIKSTKYRVILITYLVGVSLNLLGNSVPVLIRLSYPFLVLEGALLGYILMSNLKSITKSVIFLFFSLIYMARSINTTLNMEILY